MSPLAAITPSEVLHLWHSQPRHNEHSRLIAFSHALVRFLQVGRAPDAQRAPLSDLKLRTGVYNALRRAGFCYVDEVDGLPPQELMLVNHVGAASVCYIHEALANWRRNQRAKAATPAAEGPAADPTPIDPKQLQSLLEAFGAWSSDRERVAAVLIRAADLIGADGPKQLQALAMALLADEWTDEWVEAAA